MPKWFHYSCWCNPTQGQTVKVKVFEVHTWRRHVEMERRTSNISSDQNQATAPAPPPRSIVPRFIPLHLSLILMCCQPWNSTSLKVERIRVWRVGIAIERSSEDTNICYTFHSYAAAASPQPIVDSKQEEKWVHFSTVYSKFDDFKASALSSSISAQLLSPKW